MAEQDSSVNPLLAALPPATDYLTYLTIIEYNLTETNLSVLHQVLQDTELVVQIGWDLIILLLPLLPASEECLLAIATRGNPRECILKVTEALRLLEFEQDDDDSSEDQDTQGASSGKVPVSSSSSSTDTPLLYVLKYQALLSLLSTLHQRLKARFPSRFLSTSLQAVLSAYNKTTIHQDELTLAAVKFVKTLSGTKRPHLPPRTSTGGLLRTATEPPEPDPEAQKGPLADGEDTLVNRLLQAFTTHVFEDFVLCLTSENDVPGLAWSSRLVERLEPHRVVHGRKTYVERFAEEESLKTRSAVVGQLVALAQDLGISTQELLQTICDPESEKQGVPGTEDDPPSSAADIPLSKTGALLLFAARYVKQAIYASTSPAGDDTALDIFPHHAAILVNYVGTLGPQSIGLEPEALLDAVLALGLIAIQNNNIGQPTDDDQFTSYLQTLAMISVNSPSPSLRGHAHYLASTILRSHPSDIVRLTYIRDTLQHCPYENLKESAVGWLKGETMEANVPQQQEEDATDSPSIFATPVALETVGPYLFPDLTSSWTSAVEISESWMQFRTELGFYLATLNFYYLLLRVKFLRDAVDIAGLHKSSNFETSYLAPLKQAVGKFLEALEDGGELAIAEGEEGIVQSKNDLHLLEQAISQVESGIAGLGLGRS